MAAGDIIIVDGKITPAVLQQITSEVVKNIQTTAKDPGQYEEVTSLQGVTSLPVFQVSGAAYKLVRVAVSILRGIDGKEIHLQVTATHIQWRYTDGMWDNLIAIADLKGAKGETPTFRTGATGIEWKYNSEADAAWKVLVGYDVLKLKFTDLTPAQVDQLKLHFSDLSPADIATLQKPATDAAKTVTDKMAQIVTDTNTVILNTNTAKDAANTAATNANAKAGAANTAATNANTAAGAANTAAGKVNTATANAEKATAAADTATTNANTAAAGAETVKQATLQVKKETETVKTDTLKVKEDTIKAKDLAIEVANNPTRIDENCTVEIYDPVTNVYNKTAINVKGKAFTYADFTPEQLEILKGAKGDVGKTTQFGIGTVENGSVPSATLTDDGVDASGNPRKKLNLVVQKGDKGNTGFVPVMEAGTATTGLPGSSFTFELIPNGVTAEGAPKYKINMTNPKGDPGTGNGNVRVEEAGIVAGKKYLFVPSRNNISEGTFVEFKIEDFVPAGYELLFTKKATV